MKRACKDCEFCFVSPRGNGDPECRRRSPVFSQDQGRADGFPLVLLTGWCGEFQPRERGPLARTEKKS